MNAANPNYGLDLVVHHLPFILIPKKKLVKVIIQIFLQEWHSFLLKVRPTSFRSCCHNLIIAFQRRRVESSRFNFLGIKVYWIPECFRIIGIWFIIEIFKKRWFSLLSNYAIKLFLKIEHAPLYFPGILLCCDKK